MEDVTMYLHCLCIVFVILGHFIVVCGYNMKEKVIYYKNPSFKEGKSVDILCSYWLFSTNYFILILRWMYGWMGWVDGWMDE